MSLEKKEIFEFEGFRLDIGERILTRTDGSKNGQLPEKAFQTLVILVRNSGRLLTKHELIDRIWPDSFVEENNLDKCVHAIRQVLGEKPGEQKFIETVRKHGYRFVAEVTAMETSRDSGAKLLDSEFLTEPTAFETHLPSTISTATTRSGELVVSAEWSADDVEKIVQENRNIHPESQPVLEPNRTSWTIKRSIVVAVLLLAPLAAMIYFPFFRSSDSKSVAVTRSIAVLPLRPIDPANRSDIFEIGIADALIQRLTAIKGFVVLPLSASRKYTEIEQSPLVAGRELNVDYVVTSNYEIANGRIKVTSQFVNSATGKVEDTVTVEKDSANFFSAQDAIANDFGNRLLARFGSNAAEFQAKRGTNIEEAYRCYLLAMNLGEERGVDNVMRSLEYLDRAVALDPNYAQAWAAEALIHQDIVGHTDYDQREHYERSMEAIKKALSIDPNLSEAYSALCRNKSRYEFDVSGAEAACARAVQLDPRSSVAHKISASFLGSRGRFEEAIAEIRTAIDLQPVSYRNQQIYALTLYFAGRYVEAEEQFKRLLELNPNHSAFIQEHLIRVLEAQGKESEAFEYFVKVLTAQKTDNKELERFETAFRTSGWRGVVIEQIKTAEADADSSSYRLACLFAKIGNKDKALKYLEKAYQERSYQVSNLHVEPQLNSLRGDPRFDDLIRRVEGQ